MLQISYSVLYDYAYICTLYYLHICQEAEDENVLTICRRRMTCRSSVCMYAIQLCYGVRSKMHVQSQRMGKILGGVFLHSKVRR